MPPAEVDDLFDSWDPDRSGVLELDEVHRQLRQHVELNPALLPGAAGEIVLEAKNKIALRKESVERQRLEEALDAKDGAMQRVRGMKVLVNCILAAMPQMCRVFMVLVFVLLVFGIVGTLAFREGGFRKSKW